LCSKQALFLAFHVAQQMTARPKVCSIVPPGEWILAHSQYELQFEGIWLLPKHRATNPQMHLATRHWKSKWSILSSASQK
jgi:hypothetical protein